MATGVCKGCGCSVMSQSDYCVVCYKKGLHRCSTCCKVGGQLEYRYQRHKGMGEDIDCPRCSTEGRSVRHGWYKQLLCPTCGNERWVFTRPVVDNEDVLPGNTPADMVVQGENAVVR